MNNHHNFKQLPIKPEALLNDLTKKGRQVPLSYSLGFLNDLLLLALLAGILVAVGTFVLLGDGLILLKLEAVLSTFSMIAFKLASTIIGSLGCVIVAGKDYITMHVYDQELIARIIEGILPYLYHPAFLGALMYLLSHSTISWIKTKHSKQSEEIDEEKDPIHKSYFLWGIWITIFSGSKYLFFPFEGNSLWFQGLLPDLDLTKIILRLASIYPPFDNGDIRFKFLCSAKKTQREVIKRLELIESRAAKEAKKAANNKKSSKKRSKK